MNLLQLICLAKKQVYIDNIQMKILIYINIMYVYIYAYDMYIYMYIHIYILCVKHICIIHTYTHRLLNKKEQKHQRPQNKNSSSPSFPPQTHSGSHQILPNPRAAKTAWSKCVSTKDCPKCSAWKPGGTAGGWLLWGGIFPRGQPHKKKSSNGIELVGWSKDWFVLV